MPGIVSSDIDARNVAQPLRRALITSGASFRRAKIDAVDHERKVVKSDGGVEFSYDQLVIALGGQPNFFGIPGVEEYSLQMRGVEDAERIRNRVIERFEEVSLIRDEVPESKLTFVVIGGGPTGVELAGSIAELATFVLSRDFRAIEPDRTRVILIEGGPRILASFDPELSEKATKALAAMGVEVHVGNLRRKLGDDARTARWIRTVRGVGYRLAPAA